MDKEPKNMSDIMDIIERKTNSSVTIRFKLPPEKAIEVIKFVEKLLEI